METSLPENLLEIPVELPLPKRWDERLAYWASDAFCPPITGLAGILLLVASANQPAAWGWGLLAIGLIIGIPVAYILWQVRLGVISDFHIPIRSQRYRPMLLGLVCIVLTWGLLYLGGAPLFLQSLVGYGVLYSAITLLITLRWKISAHAAAIAGLLVVLMQVFGPPALLALPLAPVVMWARVRLRRHTLLQTLAGALAGAIYIWFVLR